MKNHCLSATILVLLAMPFTASAVDAERQADVARRGADVMPFSLEATTHIFTKTPHGGVQRVVVKDASDAHQIQLVREHLRQIQIQFKQGDFSAPTHIHGADMPGLTQLKAARLGEITIAYRDVTGGAELIYRTADAELVTALHAWFDAQLSDHGTDAMAGHMHHTESPRQ